MRRADAFLGLLLALAALGALAAVHARSQAARLRPEQEALSKEEVLRTIVDRVPVPLA